MKPLISKIEVIRNKESYKWIGSLTLDTVPTVWEVRDQFFEPAQPLTFDLENLQRTDSAGVAFFVSLLRQAKTKEVVITFTNLPQQFIDIAKLCGLETLFGIE